ncbi:tRNA uridine(34) 5-carboxymethylaminomethyl modification radical SAM/GNAT enzyme Elp3 [Candidatus Falkowbacteria bacterium CG10_big_fil_rev_8_21_14_0_10_38_22]|uniref:tRNA carboxymethyluridine synthase n=1 Tax=Candidatus Falkowbacteria bacterium CG10_big_fil_rev_8_21_14_0_10_38_22 TaxID=1974564 RepID=A0A2M6WRQ0_9BACT|nr:MAG: tRNA uridine(34) 5-carboxymethylaminomethyl modification radical SAM/GNAT enzyme Elp3 [Candidatus Falkowbacteria bacterium CG10_big_fil_rev_8_21_14_0_10_38_22]
MVSTLNKNQQLAIRELLHQKINSREDLAMVKRKLAKKYKIGILYNSEILQAYRRQISQKKIKPSLFLEKILRKRAVRTMSGIAPVAVLTKPYPCPGRCAYCPTEKNVPQSYLSNEPAVMRAIRCGYDPYKQVQLRLRSLEANGHQPTKIELIVIGGTWSALPEKYKYWYIKECFKAANRYESRIMNYESRKNAESHNSLFIIHDSIKSLKEKLAKEQKKNESAKYRLIGITLETRPDYINEKELLEMRQLGATRVELGVQALDDKILQLNKRGHGVAEIVQATELLKNFGFKVTYHIMPGLPGSTPAKDLKMFKQLFVDERFQPDQLKFYPTVVTRGSLLYYWWKAGKYKPYSPKVLENLIIACKKIVPPYVRIIRLIRDIPGESIIAGNMITNLRQMIKDRGIACGCIRCREAREKELRIKNYELRITKYKASGGEEYFLSYESKDGKILYGFCRLRLITRNLQLATRNSKSPLPPLLKGAGLIRELHVYGELVPVGQNKKIQHAGLGKMLMREAERIVARSGYKKIAVIAGVGVRGYYRKFGYKLKNSYMVRDLR